MNIEEPQGAAEVPAVPTPPPSPSSRPSRFGPFFALMGRALPWLSMVWGVVSGILITRRFEMATRVIAFAIGLLLVSALLGLWAGWAERQESALRKEEGGSTRRAGLAMKHKGRIDWAVATGTQIFAQYVLMFALPFLFYAQAWLHLTLTACLAASTLWDPFFLKLVRHYPYRLTLRAVGAALSTSFVVGALLPELLPLAGFLSAGGAILGALPLGGRSLWRGGVSGRALAVCLAPILGVGVAVALHQWVGGFARFPVLSVWVRGGHFALQDSAGQWRETERGRRDPTEEEVKAALAEGGRLCCVTPLVASRKLQSGIVHEWLADGERFDAIELPPVRGRDESSPYRTFSCKRNFPGGGLSDLRCRVQVGGRSAERVDVAELRYVKD